MFKSIFTPSPADIQAYIDDALGDDEKDIDFTVPCLEGFAKRLNSDPLFYRSFGVYWWPVKQLLIKHELGQFGSFVDTDITALLHFESDRDTVAVAHSYSTERVLGGHEHVFNHVIYADDEFTEYLLGDDEMEQLHLTQKLMA